MGINVRSNDIYQILWSASVSDPAAAELFADIQRQLAEGQGRAARSLARAGALRPGLREREAADLIHALVSPELFRLLVVDRRWSPRPLRALARRHPHRPTHRRTPPWSVNSQMSHSHTTITAS